jgi:chaperonin GroES
MNAVVLPFVSKLKINKDFLQAPDLTDRLKDEDLKKLGDLCFSGYAKDLRSRGPWLRRNSAALDFAMQIAKDKSFPWPNCANVIFPLITIGALQFSAKAYPSLMQGPDLIKYRLRDPDPTGQLLKRAQRVGRHMSWQMMEEDECYEEEHDKLLIYLSVAGTAYTKTFFCPNEKTPLSEFVTAKDLIVDYWATSLEKAARKTQCLTMYRNDIYERVMDGTYRDVRDEKWYERPATPPPREANEDERDGIFPAEPDEDSAYQFLEQHRLLDLDKDGYAEPYVVTLDRESKSVVRLVSRFDREEDVERNAAGKITRIHPTEYFTQWSFIPPMDGSLMGIGFGTLLGPINETVNSSINQLLDAGTLNMAAGGWLGRGAKLRSGENSFDPFQWNRVDATGDDLRKSIVPLETKEPSQVMFSLIEILIQYASQVSGATETQVGENPGQNTPAETFRGMNENGQQVFSSIFKRTWRAMRGEARIRYEMNARFLPLSRSFGPEASRVFASDYSGSSRSIAPVANPNVASATTAMWQADSLIQRAYSVDGYDRDECERLWLRSRRIEGSEALFLGAGKTPPLPNPKMAVENLKLQTKKMELDAKHQQFLMDLMEKRRLLNAQILNLESQAVSNLAGIHGDAAARELEQFELVLDNLKDHQKMLNDHIEAMTGGNSNAAPNTGGIPGVAGGPPNSGVPALAAPSPGGNQGAAG